MSMSQNINICLSSFKSIKRKGVDIHNCIDIIVTQRYQKHCPRDVTSYPNPLSKRLILCFIHDSLPLKNNFASKYVKKYFTQ